MAVKGTAAHLSLSLMCQGSSLCASEFAASPGETFAVLAPTIKQMRMLPLRLYNFSQLFWETVRAAKTGQKMRHNAHDPRSDKQNNKNGAEWRTVYFIAISSIPEGQSSKEEPDALHPFVVPR